MGVPEDEQDMVFEVFCRASNTPDQSGARLDLAMCERVITRHGE